MIESQRRRRRRRRRSFATPRFSNS